MKRSRTRLLVLLPVLAIVVLVLSGCFQITYLNLPSGIPAGSDYTITMQIKPTLSGNDISPTMAIRVPNAWEVKWVRLSGTIDRWLIESPTMETYFATTWEGKPVDAGHNGPKPGYSWWAGYALKGNYQNTDVITVTIVVDTHGASGTYSLDFVAGMTNPTGYENQALNGNGSQWELGSVGSPPPGVKLNQMTTLTASGPSFLDVPVGNPYFDAIEGMYADGSINGYDVPGGREFRPLNDVWRWQFAKMVCGALNLAVNEALVAPFPDLGADPPGTLEPHDYVAAASNNNIIKGYGDGTFRAYTPISRAQVVTMVVRAMQNLNPGVLGTPPAGYSMSLPSFDTEHTANMRIAEFNGLTAGLVGYGAGWDPWAKMNRGEVAQVLWNMMATLP